MLKQTKSPPPSNGGEGSNNSSKQLFSPFQNLSGIGEGELSSLVRRRAQPGILILNLEGDILYMNDDADILIQKLMTEIPSSTFDKASSPTLPKGEAGAKKHSSPDLPEIILQLYQSFTTEISLQNKMLEGKRATANRICIYGGMVYLFRALPLQKFRSEEAQRDIMILIERVSQGLRTDQLVELEKLTPRENEVVHLLLEGKTNKEVAVCIKIGEYTVKDHIKRIMRKYGVTTRAGIVAKVLQSHFPAPPPSPLV